MSNNNNFYTKGKAIGGTIENAWNELKRWYKLTDINPKIEEELKNRFIKNNILFQDKNAYWKFKIDLNESEVKAIINDIENKFDKDFR